MRGGRLAGLDGGPYLLTGRGFTARLKFPNPAGGRGGGAQSVLGYLPREALGNLEWLELVAKFSFEIYEEKGIRWGNKQENCRELLEDLLGNCGKLQEIAEKKK